MNTINEVCLAWFLWVNGNYDILIMTITLIVVAGLVLEVVKLRKSINTQVVDLWEDAADTYDQLCEIEEKFERKLDDQVKVNVHLAEDIAKLQRKYDSLVIMKAIRSLKPERKATKK
jgi:hypothetical protein